MTRRDAGYILITTMIALAVVALLGTATLGWAMTSLRLSRQAVEAEQAFYVANSGIEDALARVLDGQDPAALSYQVTIAPGLSGTYSVTMTVEADGSISVVSTGQVGATSRVVAAHMLPGDPGNPGGGGPGGGGPGSVPAPPGVPEEVFQQAVFSNGSLEFPNNSLICGDLYAAGSVNLGNNTRVVGTVGPDCTSVVGTGKVVATGLVSMGNNSTVAGGWCDALHYNSPGHPCPAQPNSAPLPAPNVESLNSQATERYTGDMELDGTQTYDNDIVYIDGNLNIDKKGTTISGAVTFVTTGSVYFAEGLTCSGTCSVAIIAQGSIATHENMEIWATLITSDVLALGNGVEVHGSIQATAMTTGNNPVFYPAALSTGSPPENSNPPGLTGWSS